MDFATITAAVGAAAAGVELIDKIGDQIVRFLGKDVPGLTGTHRAKIERDGQAIVQKVHGVETQRITGSDLANLPDDLVRHIRVHEKSMENHYAIWESVYPQLALMVDPVAKARTEQQLRGIVVAMKGDLLGILDFLSRAGLDLDDHYRHIRDVVSKA